MNKDSKYENYVSNCVNVFIVFQSYSLPKDFMQTSVNRCRVDAHTAHNAALA